MNCSVEQLDALADAEEAEPARAGGWVEPIAVVAHGELDRVGVLVDFDHRPVGVAMFGGVRQRLLGDPVERGFELGGVSRGIADLLHRNRHVHLALNGGDNATGVQRPDGCDIERA